MIFRKDILNKKMVIVFYLLRFFVFVMLCFSGIHAVHSKEDINSFTAEELTQLPESKLIFYASHLDGEPVSLIPLSKKQCFGEKYDKHQVEFVLSNMYKDKQPISGFAPFLGFDDRSLAIKNKEFRFSFAWKQSKNSKPNKEMLDRIMEMLDRIAAHSHAFYSLIDFKHRNFSLSDSTVKEVKGIIDLPAVFIQFAGTNREEVENFSPYLKPYLRLLNNHDESKISQYIKNVRASLAPTKKNYDDAGLFDLSHITIFTQPFDFGQDRYDFEREVPRINISAHGFYGVFSSNKKLSNDYLYRQSFQFQKQISNMFFGVRPGSPEDIKINVKTPIKSIFTNLNTKYEGVSNFEKTLFLAIYTRIKPLNMSSPKFTRSIMKVMKPCMY